MKEVTCWYCRTADTASFEFNHLELAPLEGRVLPASKFPAQAKAWKGRDWLGKPALLDSAGRVVEIEPCT
jgi:hypothetical protein